MRIESVKNVLLYEILTRYNSSWLDCFVVRLRRICTETKEFQENFSWVEWPKFKFSSACAKRESLMVENWQFRIGGFSLPVTFYACLSVSLSFSLSVSPSRSPPPSSLSLFSLSLSLSLSLAASLSFPPSLRPLSLSLSLSLSFSISKAHVPLKYFPHTQTHTNTGIPMLKPHLNRQYHFSEPQHRDLSTWTKEEDEEEEEEEEN